MAIRMIPIEEVLDRTSLSRGTLYTEISEGRFPRPVQMTARRVSWPETDIEDYLAHKIAARDGGIAA
ncbi:helix-turn-helix transcriptional regulator [Mesorhizobium sp. LjNodule214]|uniref:helix-turn-helix transcriptional regulator n=1 Tax=Mesorhizobium sp. LjNodule214 TaxID=3342252 RepID=UPI003ECC7167